MVVVSPNVSERQDTQEEIHGGVQLGVRVDGQDDEQVPCYGDQVYDEKKRIKSDFWSSGREESPRRMNSICALLVWWNLSID